MVGDAEVVVALGVADKVDGRMGHDAVSVSRRNRNNNEDEVF